MRRRYWMTLFQLPWLPVWLGPTLVMSPFLFTGKVLFWGVPYLQFVPWRAAAWQNLQLGQLPLWNPLLGMGAPLLANYQSALIYPPNWLLLIFQALGGTPAQAWAQGLVVWLHLIWAGIGTAFLCKQIGLGKMAQAVSGLAYGLSAFLVSRSAFLSINASAAWLPWVLLAAGQVKPWESRSGFTVFLRQIAPLSIVIGLQLLSGHAQLTWYTLLLAVIWFVAWNGIRFGLKYTIRCLFPFAGSAFLGVMLAAIQLIPTGEYLLQSQRAAEVGLEAAFNYSFWPWHLLTLISPWFFGSPVTGDYWFNVYYWEDAIYIGLLPLVIGILGGIHILKNRPKSFQNVSIFPSLSILLFAVLPISFLFALGRYTPIFPFLYRNIPTFDMFQGPTRWSVWAVFALVLMAGIGVEIWRRPVGRSLYWSRLATAGAAAITLGAALAWFIWGNITPTFIRALAITGLMGFGIGVINLLAPDGKEGKKPGRWSWLVVSLVIIDLLIANWGILPGYSQDLYRNQPSSLDKIKQTLTGGRLWVGKDTEYALLYIRSLSTRSYLPEIDWDQFKSFLLPDSNVFFSLPSANNYDPLVPQRYATWMEHLKAAEASLRTSMLASMDVGTWEKLDANDPSGVHFEPISHPGRFGWVPCGVPAKDTQDAWDQYIRNLDRKDANNQRYSVVILEGYGAGGANPCSIGGDAEINTIVDSPQYIKLSVHNGQAGWLVQSDVWYPGWKAKVDGKTVPIRIANTLFRAVQIPGGEHLIEIYYQPVSFILGFIISIIAGIGILFSLIFHTRGKSTDTKQRRSKRSRPSVSKSDVEDLRDEGVYVHGSCSHGSANLWRSRHPKSGESNCRKTSNT